MNNEIFALDIGTRKVMGIIARKCGDFLEILDAETIEHPTRAMFDAQIHSIEEVAKTVKKIKDNLEKRLNKKLTQVGVAVAGRNLVTYKNRVMKEFGQEQDIDQGLVRDLELEAVDRIICESGNKLSQFYCVGYSPVYYELDGQRISNLVGHRAKTIATEIIVTLLPRFTLDSMFAVLKRVGLQLLNITLEPISAINAIIPPDMRKLNILLLDIGAGTSDLALTKDGMVFAYGMVPEAGDEITERISEILLADFSSAERIKRSLQSAKAIEYEDIWGRRKSFDLQNLKQSLIPSVKRLAKSITKVALDLNGGIPQAIVLVGGGSLTFNLITELSESFGISLDSVGIRLPAAIKEIKDKTGKLTGPEAVTPIGIALMTAKASGLRFIDIEVNAKKLKMLDFYQKKDVMGALTLSGIDERKLYPHPGLALSFEVNGELKIIKGTLGQPAKVSLNGNLVSSLSDKIEHGDKIEVQEAIPGQDASAQIKDLVEINPVAVVFNGETLEVLSPVIMNGEIVGPDTLVPDRANIQTSALKIKDVLKSKAMNLDNLAEKQILVNINNNPKVLTQRNFTLRLNGSLANLNTELKNQDMIEFSENIPTFYRIKDVIEIPSAFEQIRINVDGRDIDIRIEPMQIFMNGRQVGSEEVLIDGADIQIYPLKERWILLSEIFRYIDVDPQRVLGKSMKILVNDAPAGFTTHLFEGSRVRIIFQNREGGINEGL
jgi:cell division protein FtsA